MTGQLAEEFLAASIRDWTGRAAGMLAASPQLAGHDVRAAVVLGDAGRVREALARDPGLATRPDGQTGWTALHLVCASRWHRLDPSRAPGMTAVARLLLDAGADPAGVAGGWTPLRCAVAGAANPAITQLLLDRGAVPGDHDVYLACFGGDGNQSLRLLLARAPDLSGSDVLSAPVSTGDAEAAALLLAAGADPARPLPRGESGAAPWPAVHAAVDAGCPAELLELLLRHGADPGAPAPDGLSPLGRAVSRGRDDLAAVLRAHGAREDLADAELLVAACLRGDGAAARELAARHPPPAQWLAPDAQAAIVRAAESGNARAVALMLDTGFPVGARGDDGATALHAAAYAGSSEVVRLLTGRGADLEARDSAFGGTPLDWAVVGSGEQPDTAAGADWVATVEALLAAGASAVQVSLSPGGPKPPSPQVARLLRAAGAGS